MSFWSRSRSTPKCSVCHMFNHNRRNCPEMGENYAREFEDNNYMFCTWCEKADHCGRECPEVVKGDLTIYEDYDRRCRNLAKLFAESSLRVGQLVLEQRLYSTGYTGNMFMIESFREVYTQGTTRTGLRPVTSFNIVMRINQTASHRNAFSLDESSFRPFTDTVLPAEPMTQEDAERFLFPHGIGNREHYKSEAVDVYLKKYNEWKIKSSLPKKRKGKTKENG